MRVLIVDDEPAALQRLGAMLEELDVEVVGVAHDGMQALELALERRPDLVLLDIAMPEIDGFDVARHLPEPRPLIVFQTAHDEHALRAFEHEAVDYLLKPVTLERLRRAIDRAARRLNEADTPRPGTAELERARTRVHPNAPPPRRILVRYAGGHRLAALADVDRFATEGGEVYAHAAGASYLCDYTLAELEVRLAGAFVRASRGELVNLERIERILPAGDGAATLTLRDGTRVPVSRRRAASVRQALER